MKHLSILKSTHNCHNLPTHSVDFLCTCPARVSHESRRLRTCPHMLLARLRASLARRALRVGTRLNVSRKELPVFPTCRAESACVTRPPCTQAQPGRMEPALAGHEWLWRRGKLRMPGERARRSPDGGIRRGADHHPSLSAHGTVRGGGAMISIRKGVLTPCAIQGSDCIGNDEVALLVAKGSRSAIGQMTSAETRSREEGAIGNPWAFRNRLLAVPERR
jgi:hypothetical protein